MRKLGFLELFRKVICTPSFRRGCSHKSLRIRANVKTLHYMVMILLTLRFKYLPWFKVGVFHVSECQFSRSSINLRKYKNIKHFKRIEQDWTRKMKTLAYFEYSLLFNKVHYCMFKRGFKTRNNPNVDPLTVLFKSKSSQCNSIQRLKQQ